MKSWWRLALAGAAAYLVFVVAGAPAAKLVAYVQPRLPAVQFAGVSGSLWSGRAAQVGTGALHLDAVRWRWRPVALFRGALEFAVSAELGGQPLVGRAGLGLLGGAYATDVVGRLPVADLLYWTGMTRVGLDGELDFVIDDIEGLGAGLPAAAGTLTWSPARVHAPLTLDLGQAQLVTRIESGATRGKLSASGGALNVAGDLSLNPDGAYSLVAEVQKNGSVPQAVDRFLAAFAEFRDGTYRLEWSDRLKL
jgi:hypothetical protein